MSSGNWMNGDGLYVEFGTTKATLGVAGEYKTYGELREILVDIDLTTIGSTPTILDNNLKFPTGVRIQEVVVVAHTAAVSGGSSTLDIGLVKEDRTTAISATGIVAALPKASYDAAGEQNTITPGATNGGALLGTVTSDVGYLTANWNTAAFTAGDVRVRIRYYAFGQITQ